MADGKHNAIGSPHVPPRDPDHAGDSAPRGNRNPAATRSGSEKDNGGVPDMVRFVVDPDSRTIQPERRGSIVEKRNGQPEGGSVFSLKLETNPGRVASRFLDLPQKVVQRGERQGGKGIGRNEQVDPGPRGAGNRPTS